MSRLETVVNYTVFGAIFPILFFLAGWWGSVGLVPENKIFIFAFAGLGLGLLIDLCCLSKIIRRVYTFNYILLMVIYVFYAVCVFGFFMGVPVFNILPGIAAGFYMGRRLRHTGCGRGEAATRIRNTGVFTAAVLLFFCVAAAFLALTDTHTAANLEGMLHLPFSVTQPMILLLLLFGGSALVFLQYLLTRKTAELVLR